MQSKINVIADLIQNSGFSDFQKQELLAYYQKHGTDAGFFERYLAFLKELLGGHETKAIHDWNVIRDGLNETKKVLEEKEKLLLKETERDLEPIHPFDVPKRQVIWNQYYQKVAELRSELLEQLKSKTGGIVKSSSVPRKDLNRGAVS